jgi:uncharacterized membrane protein YdbT with pleckstrin-like domain
MGYLDRLLADRETVILKAHRHMIFVILHMIPYVLLTIALWALAAFLATQTDETLRTVLLLVLLVGSLIPLGRALYKFLIWRREEYVVTNHRIIQVEGLLNKRTFDSSLEKVNDVQMKQSVFGRLFGFGDIEIITGSDIGVNKLWGIANPFEFKRALLEAKIAVEQPMYMRRSSDQREEDGFEAARLLAALTDLRDSGVISAEEYELRRRQLLRQN